jgi:catalase
MPPDADDRYSLRALLRPASLARLAVIGAILLLIVAGFVWDGWFFFPHHLDQARFVHAFQEANGRHPGFRRNHEKGVCLSGWFDGNGAGVPLSHAGLFKPGRVPVFGRFSLAGGMQPDSPKGLHAMALNFALADGEAWRTAMVPLPVFIVNNAKSFYGQLVASIPDPKTGKPDPAKMKAFLATHPETVRALGLIKAHAFASGFANDTYNSLNAFRFVNAQGVSTPVRWSMVAVDAFEPASAKAPSANENYLFDALAARVAHGPVQWHLVVTIGRPGDPTNDATVPWPADRTRVDVGTLTVTGLQTEVAGNCRDINFDPMVLPSGIAPSDDPLLSARSAVYSADFTKRVSEPKTPSPVQIGQGQGQ